MKTLRKNNKIAFFTIDVERFCDTECIYKAKHPVNKTMLDGLDRYIEILDSHGIKATLFVLSEFADKVADKLKEYLKNGHKIALHGERHIPPVMLSNEEFKNQITRAKEKVENLIETEVLGYRAPCFGIDREKLDILKSIGFKYDSSKMDYTKARHTSKVDMSNFDYIGNGMFKNGSFFEFGISTGKIFGCRYPVSGGGYIRISNWFFSRFLLSEYFKKGKNYMFYCHPFEFSSEKPPKVPGLKFYDRFYIKYGIKTYPKKLEYIIKKLTKRGYTFSTFEDEIVKSDSNAPSSVNQPKQFRIS